MLEADQILRAAHGHGASDVHLTAHSPVMLRINGELRQAGQGKLAPEDTQALARQLMEEPQYTQFLDSGDADFAYSIEGLCRFRVNAYRQRGAVGLTIRLIPSAIPSLEHLGMPLIVQEFASKPQGLVLVTGPTGSGKSTTLAAMIDYINRTRREHIVTLEDPIEFQHAHNKSIINQREVGIDTSSFGRGLRAALRQDPDVVLVGEMRDLETISTAITAAETGHLVFGTLHTADAPQTIDRIIDVFPPAAQQQIRIQLAAVLLGVLAQRLLPTADGTGRVAAIEILVNTPAIANLIRSEKVHQIRSIMQTSKSAGMQTMDGALRELVQQKQITVKEARQALFGFDELQV